MNSTLRRVLGEDEDFAREMLSGASPDVSVLIVNNGNEIKLCEVFTSPQYAVQYLYEWCRLFSQQYDDETEPLTDEREQRAYIEAYFRNRAPTSRFVVFNRESNPSLMDDTRTGSYFKPNEWD